MQMLLLLICSLFAFFLLFFFLNKLFRDIYKTLYLNSIKLGIIQIKSIQLTKKRREDDNETRKSIQQKKHSPINLLFYSLLLSLQSRQNHLKKCAQTFHIKTESLFELIKKQQESLEHDLARGLVPTNV